MHWEVLARMESAVVRRRGRFVVAELGGPHLVFSTSTKNGGQSDRVRYLVNHQSCEGAGHESRAHVVTAGGQDTYHDDVCREIDVPPDAAAVMGTAANMNYTAIASEHDGGVVVTAVVTGGVQTNATCAGDPASWRETRDGVVKVPPVVGTINTMLLVNTPVTVSALTRTIVTMTEGKSAALQRLAVPSCASADLATGTGTDQFCVAAPCGDGPPLTSASPHMKFGEIVGLAVRRATLEALRWQNGLEPSYTRGLFHALGRYGVKEVSIFDDLGAHLEPEALQLLRRNSKSAFYEPLVGAAAHAMATVLDRARHETLPAGVIPDAIVGQAATLAVALAAQPERWPEFRARLHEVGAGDPRVLVLAAVALGWREKWRTN
jgi:adenosylcobinamide amidohydrolase